MIQNSGGCWRQKTKIRVKHKLYLMSTGRTYTTTLTRAEKGLNKSIHRRKWGKLIRDQREQVQNIQNIIVTTLQ